MDTKRLKLYEELKTKIGKTPLVKYKGEVPNNNIIYIKRECDNPFGSHYDRVYLALFKHYEDLGRSTRAGISVALEIAKMIKGKNLLVIAYDKAERYDS